MAEDRIRHFEARVQDLERQLVQLRTHEPALPTDADEAPEYARRMRRIVDRFPHAAAYIDRRYVYRYANQGYLDFFGIPAERLIGKTVPESLGPEAFEVVRPHLERVLSGEVVEEERYVSYPPERGGPRWVSAWLLPDQASDGRIAGYFGMMVDLTPQKRAEAALAQSEERYRRLVELNPDGIVVHQDGVIVYANPSAIRLARGQDVADMVGRWVMDFVRPDYRPLVVERVSAVQSGADLSPTIEEVFLRLDGSEMDAEVTSIAISWQGAPAVQAIFRDIGSRKQAEAENQALHARLQAHAADLEARVEERTQALREKVSELEAFSYSVSHDLRAPLRAIEGFSAVLLEEYGASLDDTGREYAQRMRAAALRLDGLLRDLLAYARVARTELTLDAIELDDLVAEVTTQVEGMVRERGATLEVARALPRVRAHRATLGLALQNLVLNALTFVPKERTPEVRIDATIEEEQRLVLRVRDNGIGIEPRFHSRIFRMFERLHGPEAYPGTGIGLALVEKAVSRMHGQVGVTSIPGEGSTFWIDLPLAR